MLVWALYARDWFFHFFPFRIQIFMFAAECLSEVIIGVDGLIFYAKDNKKRITNNISFAKFSQMQ